MLENKELKMNIRINNLIDMLETYYNEKYETNGSLLFDENNIDTIDLRYVYGVSVNKYNFLTEFDLTKEDIKNALSDILGKLNYEVLDIEFEKGEKGYKRDLITYITGIKAYVKEKDNQKILKLE